MHANKFSVVSVAPCLLAIVVDSLGYGLVYPVMTAMFAGHNTAVLPADASMTYRHFCLSLGFLLYPLFMFFGGAFMGDLSDVLGRRKVMLICMLGLLLSFLMMGVGVDVKSVLLIMVGRALGGLMAGSQPISQAAVSDMSTPQSKALNMAFLSLATAIGIVVGPLMGGITSDPSVVSWFNFDVPFYLATILALVTLIWLFFSFKDSTIAKGGKVRLSRLFTIFIDAAKHQQLRLLVMTFFLVQVGWGIYFAYTLVVLHLEFHYTSAMLGVFNAFIGAGLLVGMLVLIRMMLKYFSVRTTAALSILVVAVTELITVWTFKISLFWIVAFFCAAFDMVAFTAMLTTFSDVVAPNKQGWALGLGTSTIAIAWAMTGLFANLISSLGARGILLLGGISVALSFVFMLYFVRQFKRDARG